MIHRRVQSAIRSALVGHRITSKGVTFSQLANIFVHMHEDGKYSSAWVPDPVLIPERIYAEKPPDNLKVYPFVCMHNSRYPIASHTGDVTVHDAGGQNPERYPGHTCWLAEWTVFAEDRAESPARAERVVEIIDSAMELVIANGSLDLTLPEDKMDTVTANLLPVPPMLRVLNFRRIGLTEPYDEWYDGRRYWWRGLKYEVMLEEDPPVHSSEK